MRKHKIRHILHGLLDLLPLFVIPVFMVYSHRHAIDNYSVTVDGAYFQLEQEVINGKPNDNADTYLSDDYGLVEYYTDTDYLTIYIDEFPVYTNYNFTYSLGDKIYFSFDICCTEGETEYVFVYNDERAGSFFGQDITDSFVHYSTVITSTRDVNSPLYIGSAEHYEFYIKNMQIFNLTDIFGTGNEPTVEQFNDVIGDTYYEYGQTYNVFLPYGTTTYNATDIGSQFIYSLYNATVNYFNTDSVFNLSSLHSWITNNFFNGNMPLGVTVVYHVIVYELIMDIIFLIYAVFMFIVDFASDFLEHCFTWSRRGGN